MSRVRPHALGAADADDVGRADRIPVGKEQFSAARRRGRRQRLTEPVLPHDVAHGMGFLGHQTGLRDRRFAEQEAGLTVAEPHKGERPSRRDGAGDGAGQGGCIEPDRRGGA